MVCDAWAEHDVFGGNVTCDKPQGHDGYHSVYVDGDWLSWRGALGESR